MWGFRAPSSSCASTAAVRQERVSLWTVAVFHSTLYIQQVSEILLQFWDCFACKHMQSQHNHNNKGTEICQADIHVPTSNACYVFVVGCMRQSYSVSA